MTHAESRAVGLRDYPDTIPNRYPGRRVSRNQRHTKEATSTANNDTSKPKDCRGTQACEPNPRAETDLFN